MNISDILARGSNPKSQVWLMEESALRMYLSRKAEQANMPYDDEDQDETELADGNSSALQESVIVGNVAIISIIGTLDKYPFTDVVSTLSIQAQLNAAVADPSVSAILLMIDSLGGSVGGISSLANAVFDARQRKPIYAYVSDRCCSAAIWIASQASKVYANDTAMIGSIGAFRVLMDSTGAAEQAGIKYTVIRSGPYKAGAGEGAEVTEDGISQAQATIDAIAGLFVKAIARGRGMEISKAAALADGSVWIGQSAVDVGLIDGIADIETAYSQLLGETIMSTDTNAKAEAEVKAEAKEIATPEVKPQEIKADAQESVTKSVTSEVNTEVKTEAAPEVKAEAKPEAQQIDAKAIQAAAYEDGAKDTLARFEAVLAACGDRLQFAIAQFKAGHDVAKAKSELADVLIKEQSEQASGADRVAGFVNQNAQPLDVASAAAQDWDNNTDNVRKRFFNKTDFIAWRKYQASAKNR